MTAQQRQRELIKLRAAYGDTWEIWRTIRAHGSQGFCARRHDGHRTVLSAGIPEELANMITEAEGETSDLPA